MTAPETPATLADPHEGAGGSGGRPHEFAVSDTEILYDGPIFALRRDHVRMPGGRVATREKVEHFGAVAIAALDEDDRLVMIYQYRPALGARIWEMPAGLLDDPDEEPVVAAQRELVEEVGIEADEWSTLVDIVGCPGFADESVRVFLARGLRSVERPDGGDDEEADLVIRRVPLDDLVTGAMAGALVNGPCVAGVFAAAAVRDGKYTPRPVDAPWDHKPTDYVARRDTRG
ncbi:NUDIX domain-containing protein [Actinomycetospora cinnamomea]|uniref:ADP-ribose pyrophosphatase n=1 Tax=Actinomycetospora cinnamomea TaxID=663609 RepID=A0A2U1EAG9_9PSEU|nr:NUDIX hydrolase [Actinomycetospora cinnamomea]PVY96885.1 ADP-ribose pyrophosphatase [Actinomycetospora cinnamomea]